MMILLWSFFLLSTIVDGARKTSLCNQLATFTPNLCSYPIAKQNCEMCKVKPLVPRVLQCGKKSTQKVPPLSKRIVGGETSKAGDWPWHVSMRINDKQWCSGSILSEKFVLTAAHCFHPQYTSIKAEDWEVYAGDHHLINKDVSEQRIGVKQIITHANLTYSEIYTHADSGLTWGVIDNDVAILVLEKPLRLGDADKTHICLPNNIKRIPDRQECTIVGWGHTTNKGSQPDELNEAKVRMVPNLDCNEEKVYNNTIPTSVICAGYKIGGIDACQFDSGGAMVCEKKGRWYATGLVSSGSECASANKYGLYTNVADYNNWIIEAILTKLDA